MVPGYNTAPNFNGFRDAGGSQGSPSTVEYIDAAGDSGAQPPAAPAVAPAPVLATVPQQAGTSQLIENAVVYGGVPLCGYIFLTKRGPSSLLAGLLGAGLAYLYWQSGSTEV